MKKKSLFRRVSGVLTGLFFSTSLILAANENGQLFGSETLIVVVALLLFFVPLFLYVRKLHSNMNDRSDRIIKENAALENLNKEINARNEEVNTRNEELDSLNRSLEGQIEQQEERYRALREQNDDLAQANNDLVRKNNELELTISTLNNNKKELEQLIVTKIKENDMIQREAADKLAEAEKRLKDAESINDNFFIETIHEMRTPLSLVLGSLALVVQNDDPEKDMSTQLLSAYRNTLAMQDLADQLIGTHRSNDVANYLRIARYDMVEIARQICDIFVDWVAMNNIDFRINTQTPALWVWMDRRKMEFALRMLLSNAFKNTFVYGKVTLDISVVNENGKAYSALVVTDEGLDEDESTRRGLKQIMDMADAIGGMYRSESDKNGTSYIIMIPLGKQHLLDRRVEFVEPESDLVKLNARQKEEIAELIHVIPQKKETGKKLLVIDDSDQIRWFLKHVFNKEYQILEARNGQDGINVALKEEPDLILCDVMMPVKDGFECCREVKENPETCSIPFIMLTAKVEDDDIIHGLQLGADDYVLKPFTPGILKAKVSSLINGRQTLKQMYTKLFKLPGTDTIVVSEPEQAGEEVKTEDPFITAVIKIVEENICEADFSVKKLAAEMNMSQPTLYRKVKQSTDYTIIELIRGVRMRRAGVLLKTKQYAVQEVAEMVGYNDIPTFRKHFVDAFGTTPSTYE